MKQLFLSILTLITISQCSGQMFDGKIVIWPDTKGIIISEEDSLKTEVAPSDTLNLSFQDVPVGEEQWLLLVGQVKAVAKAKVSGKIIAETNDSKENSYSFSSFRLRRNPTYQWVVAPASNSSTLQIDIVWQEEAEVDYAELSNRLELPFTLCEAELLLAIHSNNGDIRVQ